MPDKSFIDDFVKNIDSNAFNDFRFDRVSEEKKLVTIYHSVPKSVMTDPKYLKAISSHFSTDVKHVLDCPESNLPELAQSEANFFSDKIKLACPNIF